MSGSSRSREPGVYRTNGTPAITGTSPEVIRLLEWEQSGHEVEQGELPAEEDDPHDVADHRPDAGQRAARGEPVISWLEG